LSGGTQSGISNEAMATIAPTAPTITSELYADTVIRVAWVITNQIITDFVIERSTDGNNFSPIDTVPANYKDILILDFQQILLITIGFKSQKCRW
jgi:hypothetical protein